MLLLQQHIPQRVCLSPSTFIECAAHDLRPAADTQILAWHTTAELKTSILNFDDRGCNTPEQAADFTASEVGRLCREKFGLPSCSTCDERSSLRRTKSRAGSGTPAASGTWAEAGTEKNQAQQNVGAPAAGARLLLGAGAPVRYQPSSEPAGTTSGSRHRCHRQWPVLLPAAPIVVSVFDRHFDVLPMKHCPFLPRRAAYTLFADRCHEGNQKPPTKLGMLHWPAGGPICPDGIAGRDGGTASGHHPERLSRLAAPSE